MIVSLSRLPDQPLFADRTPYDFDADDPRGLHHLSLEQQKKQAKQLLKQWRERQPDAIERAKRILSKKSLANLDDLKLSDAQHVIAREQRFRNWADFKAHIEQSRIERDAVKKGNPRALDADLLTLHIRCGTDIRHAMTVAGFRGDFIPFFDPYVQGPVPETKSLDEFIDIRTRFIERDYRASGVKELLIQDYKDLARAHEYPRVALWLEHDSYDQLILARLLHWFHHHTPRPRHLQFISVTHYPGVKRFNGIGHLPPDAMRVLWGQFVKVEEPHLQLGARAWDAITSPTPEALYRLVTEGTDAIATMAIACRRHLQELPSLKNGLALTEQLTLQILADKGSMNAARLFGWYTNHYEPLPFLGDTGFWTLLNNLADASHPAISMVKASDRPKDWQLELKPLGEDLLSGRADWIDLNGIDRWHGGTRLDSKHASVWRYDDSVGLVQSR